MSNMVNIESHASSMVPRRTMRDLHTRNRPHLVASKLDARKLRLVHFGYITSRPWCSIATIAFAVSCRLSACACARTAFERGARFHHRRLVGMRKMTLVGTRMTMTLVDRVGVGGMRKMTLGGRYVVVAHCGTWLLVNSRHVVGPSPRHSSTR